MGTDRVCGMDEFCVEVVNIAEEAECLKEAAKAAAKSKDKEGAEEETEIISSIPCTIQVSTQIRPWYDWMNERDLRHCGDHSGQIDQPHRLPVELLPRDLRNFFHTAIY